MLWLKGWLETRYRLLFIAGGTTVISLMTFFHRSYGSAQGLSVHTMAFVSYTVPFLMMMICAMLGGAGVATQSALRASKGLHGSSLFTLSMPVSRLRLLAVRAGIGWMEVWAVTGVLCCEMWFLSPWLRSAATPAEMVGQAAALIACGSAIYYLSVLLATVLDDQWRTWGTMLIAGGLWWLCVRVPFLAPVNVFEGMGKGSPLVAHTMPWDAMAVSAGLSVVLFLAALKIVQRREF
jgi:hypothetical protein